MIKNFDRSICSTCAFLKDCTLTSNHNAIWSCSEYELDNSAISQETSNEQQYNFTTLNQKLEFIN